MTTHDVVILAAGGSKRLGEPKQALRAQGETLLDRAVRLATATHPACIVRVVGDDAASWPPIDGVTTLRNPDWGTGLASSIRVAANHLAGRPHPVLVLVVDQPALTAEHLRALLATFDGENDVVTAYGDAIGVPAIVRATTLARAHELAGDTGLRRLWTAIRPGIVRADELGIDIDTPEDLARCRATGLIDPAV